MVRSSTQCTVSRRALRRTRQERLRESRFVRASTYRITGVPPVRAASATTPIAFHATFWQPDARHETPQSSLGRGVAPLSHLRLLPQNRLGQTRTAPQPPPAPPPARLPRRL